MNIKFLAFYNRNSSGRLIYVVKVLFFPVPKIEIKQWKIIEYADFKTREQYQITLWNLIHP